MAGLPVDARRRLTKHAPELLTRVQGLVESFVGGPEDGIIELESPGTVEPRKGAGLGPLLSPAEGEQALSDYTVGRRLEAWAGPVAGATALAREHGVARSTLNHWQHRGKVIGLLKGTRKLVYPIAQFVDGRPAKGIANINAIAGNPRVAWLWLSRPNPTLAGHRPIDLLKRDRIKEVIDAAHGYFDQP